MSRLAFLHRTDVHLAEQGPASWKGDYVAEIWANLEYIGKLARDHQVNAVLDTGDYFHIKTSSRNSHSSIIRSAKTHSQYGCPTFCVEGNHDLAYNNLDSIEKQPLGVLYATGVFQHLREEVFKDGGLTVRVVGVPYSPFRTLDQLRSIQKKPGDDFLIVGIHALAGHNPPSKAEDFFNEPVFNYEDLITPNGPDLFLFGHWHKDQGVVEIQGRQFINQGALSRGALNNENLTRIPKASMIEVTPSGLQVVTFPMQVAPAEEVFNLERKERQDKETKEIEEFVKNLSADAQFDPSSSISDNLKAFDFAADVKSTIERYLELARAEAGVG